MQDYQMSERRFIGTEIDKLVKKLSLAKTVTPVPQDVVKALQEENQGLRQQLFRYAEDMQTLLAETDNAAIHENEKKSAYKQLERFNEDFLVLIRQKEKSYQELELSHLDTIRRLAAAAEFKDDDTGVHIVRMSRFASMIASAYGQDEKYCNLLEQASPMHDIGKIGIPDNVLKKPGKLTQEEWECMRKHPEYGANILAGSNVPVLKMAEEVALSHHEKFDGTGYPLNLKGHEIPLSGRIVALADFFDAVTMDRCYRPAFSDEKALAMVKENDGSHFDPDVVIAFFSISDEIIKVRNRINQDAL
jgi:putative two-component system response regulator